MLCNNGVAGPHNLFILNVNEEAQEVKGVLRERRDSNSQFLP